jgi:hypothetical protein
VLLVVAHPDDEYEVDGVRFIESAKNCSGPSQQKKRPMKEIAQAIILSAEVRQSVGQN